MWWGTGLDADVAIDTTQHRVLTTRRDVMSQELSYMTWSVLQCCRLPSTPPWCPGTLAPCPCHRSSPPSAYPPTVEEACHLDMATASAAHEIALIAS
jgi:hypothetical protein